MDFSMLNDFLEYMFPYFYCDDTVIDALTMKASLKAEKEWTDLFYWQLQFRKSHSVSVEALTEILEIPMKNKIHFYKTFGSFIPSIELNTDGILLRERLAQFKRNFEETDGLCFQNSFETEETKVDFVYEMYRDQLFNLGVQSILYDSCDNDETLEGNGYPNNSSSGRITVIFMNNFSEEKDEQAIIDLFRKYSEPFRLSAEMFVFREENEEDDEQNQQNEQSQDDTDNDMLLY